MTCPLETPVTLKWSSKLTHTHTLTHRSSTKHLDVPVSMNALIHTTHGQCEGTCLSSTQTHTPRHSSAHTLYHPSCFLLPLAHQSWQQFKCNTRSPLTGVVIYLRSVPQTFCISQHNGLSLMYLYEWCVTLHWSGQHVYNITTATSNLQTSVTFGSEVLFFFWLPWRHRW